jgi:outer membrane protein TolC
MRAVLTALVLAWPLPGWADSDLRIMNEQLENSPGQALEETLAALEGEGLSLETAIELALLEASPVREARAGLAAAESSVIRERGGFDPELFLDLAHSATDLPTASFFSGANVLETEETTAVGGVRVDLPTGTEIEASLSSIRGTTNSGFASLNPQYDSYTSLTIRHPLLAGSGAAAREDLSFAERRLEATRARYADAVFGVRGEVEALYWDLYAAERDLAVQILIRSRAASLLEEAQLRADVGLVGPGQVASARVFLAEQVLAELDRQERLDAVSDSLASLIGRRPATGQIRFHPLDEPLNHVALEAVESLVTRARDHNQLLLAARYEMEALEVRVEAARMRARPTVNIFGSLGHYGLSGEGQDIMFGDTVFHNETSGNITDAWGQIGRWEYPSWSLGLQFLLPVGLRQDRGEYRRLQAEVDRAAQQLLEAERLLEEEVRASHREIVNGTRRLEAAENGVEAALEQVRIGLIEFRNGRITAFELVRLGADMAAAQQRYSDALVRTAKAAARLRQQTSGRYPERSDSKDEQIDE